MKRLITEETILQMQYSRVQGRPCVVLEDFEHYTRTEQQQINEAYNIIYDLLQQEVIQEFSLSGAKAKVKGKIAGVKAGLQGDSNAEDAGKQAELQSLFDDLKKNIGTIVAQHEKDVTKLGFGPEDQISKSLTQIRQAIESSPADIEIKDSSLTGKVGQFATDKVLPLISKAIKPVADGIGILYDKSGPVKNFDTKYQQLISQISQKYPNLAEPIAKFSKFAKQHKGKATFIIGGLTAILTASGALAAGGLGAMAVGVGLRGIYGLLSGEPPAKAFGKAAITAAIGKLAGSAMKDLFADVDVSGADETMTKAGIGELTGGEEVADMGPVAARNAALDALQDKYPDASSFRELMELDPEAAEELQKSFARTGSSTSMNAAEEKIDLLMKGNEVTDAGMDSGKFVGGELQTGPSTESGWFRDNATGGVGNYTPMQNTAIDIAHSYNTTNNMGISPEWLLDVMEDPEAQKFFMNGNVINRNKLNGVLDALVNNSSGTYLPTGDEIGETLNSVAAGETGASAAGDVASDQAVPRDLDSFGSESGPIDGSNYNDKIEELEELRKGFDQKSMDPEVSSDQRARYDELVKDTDDKINQLYNGGQNYRQIAKLKDVINKDIKDSIEFITDTANEPHAAAQNLQMIKQLRANDVIHNYLDHQNKLPIDQIGGAVNVDSIKSVIEKIADGDQATINQIISFGEREGFLPTGETAGKLDQLEAHLMRTAR